MYNNLRSFEIPDYKDNGSVLAIVYMYCQSCMCLNFLLIIVNFTLFIMFQCWGRGNFFCLKKLSQQK